MSHDVESAAAGATSTTTPTNTSSSSSILAVSAIASSSSPTLSNRTEDETDTDTDIDTHITQISLLPVDEIKVTCELCGVLVPKSLVASHERTECEAVEIDCPLSAAAATTQITENNTPSSLLVGHRCPSSLMLRSELPQHLQQDVGQHLAWLLSVVSAQSASIATLLSDVRMLSSQLAIEADARAALEDTVEQLKNKFNNTNTNINNTSTPAPTRTKTSTTTPAAGRTTIRYGRSQIMALRTDENGRIPSKINMSDPDIRGALADDAASGGKGAGAAGGKHTLFGTGWRGDEDDHEEDDRSSSHSHGSFSYVPASLSSTSSARRQHPADRLRERVAARQAAQGGQGQGQGQGARARPTQDMRALVSNVHSHNSRHSTPQQVSPSASAYAGPVTPLKPSGNAWQPKSVPSSSSSSSSSISASTSTSTFTPTLTAASGSSSAISNTAELQKRVKSILNKLTLEKFDKLSDQIVQIARDATDIDILVSLVSIMFEKALGEAFFASMYAQLCAKVDKMAPDFQGDKARCFKFHLLNKCQTEFEAGIQEISALKDGETMDEAKQKQKRRMLGNIRFIGELYKQGLIIDVIMHACIRHLMTGLPTANEEDVEGFCKLMSTVGGMMDTNNKEMMTQYMKGVSVAAASPSHPSRVRFMLLDLIELRSRAWKPRIKQEEAKKLDEIHAENAPAMNKQSTFGSGFSSQSQSRDRDRDRDGQRQQHGQGYGHAQHGQHGQHGHGQQHGHGHGHGYETNSGMGIRIVSNGGDARRITTERGGDRRDRDNRDNRDNRDRDRDRRR